MFLNFVFCILIFFAYVLKNIQTFYLINNSPLKYISTRIKLGKKRKIKRNVKTEIDNKIISRKKLSQVSRGEIEKKNIYCT